jgi:glycosyltransferase involved in cell wall biosynthesis
MNRTQRDLSVIVPVYNEVEVIDAFYNMLTEIISRMAISYEVLFVDDGSDVRRLILNFSITFSGCFPLTL